MASLYGDNTNKDALAGINKFFGGVGAGIGGFFGSVGAAMGQQANPYGQKPVAPKPSNANISKPAAGASVAENYRLNQVKAPKATPTGGGSASAAAAGKTKSKSIYDYLNVNPTPIYDPLMNLINEQKQAANKRYETNSAEIKNIFSALSGVAPADRVRINEQFKNMLTAQQTALANRTAAATAQGNAGAAQAVATGAERGGGEAMALNPLQTATAEGIAGSNQISSIWEGLQGANQAQALADVDTRQEGYNYQQVAAIQGLQQSLEDRLAGIAGTEADVQSQLAKAKFDIASNIGQQKYNNALAAQRAAATGTKAPSGLAGLQAKIGNDAFGQLAGGANDAYSAAWAALNPTDALGKPVSKTVKTPRDSDVKAAWVAARGNPALLPYLSQYVSSIYG